MCGIAGFYGNLNKEQSVSTLQNMLTRIKHRGPDQSGVYIADKVGLGSVRLSIIDLSSGGAMPISNQDESLWIVFNGEVYNYIELKEDLLKKNHKFKTSTDTEVIVHLYEEYGPECVKMLNGQFAFAIWDKTKEELFLARDRVGIRPLFYTQLDGNFVFGSEIKTFLEYPGIDLKFSEKALSEYVTFWTALPPNTVFEDVFEVAPGSYMLIQPENMSTTTYWELPLVKPDAYTFKNVEEAAMAFENIFLDSIK